jgi:hypothetical protein
MSQKQISTFLVSAIFLLLMSVSYTAQAQCRTFVRANCIPNLSPYIHDGSYQAVVIRAGEEAEVYKTIFEGQRYRLFVCVDEQLPGVEFVVTDIRRNVLFDNRRNGNVKVWDFRPTASQQIKVTIRIPRVHGSDGATEVISGCVGMLFGLLDN